MVEIQFPAKCLYCGYLVKFGDHVYVNHPMGGIAPAHKKCVEERPRSEK